MLGLVSAHDQIDLLAQVGRGGAAVRRRAEARPAPHPPHRAGGAGHRAGPARLHHRDRLRASSWRWARAGMEALYVAVALTFSSTIIIVKLLSDKRELDSLHGRIAVGFLIVQDLAVVIAMMADERAARRGAAAATPAGRRCCCRWSGAWRPRPALLFVLMRWVLPRLVAAMARSQELLLVFAIAWGVALAAPGRMGRLQQGGGRLPGRLLARLDAPTARRSNARLTGIRDFLLLFFFIDLGAKLDSRHARRRSGAGASCCRCSC
ncbi:MAG: cation:proton antiporter [Comamonadaceae bacterium]|nr:cation:proton antiporter [Comamonadaceae bacterium]